jgi:hypothetical protein
VGDDAFFALSRLRAQSQKSMKARRKKSAEKAKTPSAKENHREFALFPPTYTGRSVPKPKPLGRGKTKGLE